MSVGIGILGSLQSLSVWLGTPPAAVDPLLLVPFCIVAFSLLQLRQCMRAGWHRAEAWVPPATGSRPR